ncbi:MAG: OmpA family protein [Ignavibacteriales bacterium]|nr:OmpA family protein [Ignavibacteriales bacterium]
MKRLIIISIVFLTTLTFPQKRTHTRDHAFSGTVVISLEGGSTYGYTDYYDFILDYAGRGMIEYFIPTSSAGSLGLRAFTGGGYLSGKDGHNLPDKFRTDLFFAGGGLVYTLSLGNVIFPYIFGGVSYLHFNPKNTFGDLLVNNNLGAYEKTALNFNGEFGFRFLLSQDLSFNINGAVYINPNDNLDDGKFKIADRNNDLFFTGMAGVSFSLFGKRDSDGDGIYNGDDKCPDQPEDYDGFMDEDGCTDYDNDNDGIKDRVDQCPNRQEDFDGFMDEDGCPDVDNDGDGILDFNDQCPNEPEDFDGFQDTDGCPDFDNDNDGILDKYDKCPNASEKFNGYEDEDGCPDEVPAPKIEQPKTEPVREIILSAGTTFEIGKSTLSSYAFEELDKIVEVIKNNPGSNWRIEGHTDNTGSNKTNKKISLARANAVLQYFLSKGLVKNRFEVVGLGKDFPVAENRTEAGRAKNRRVVILRVN